MNRGKRLTVVLSLGLVLAMVGLAAAAAPLYRMFCQVTGYGGTPKRVEAVAAAASDRMVTVRFDASVVKGIPWRFEPRQRQMTVRLGEETLAVFTATNTSDHEVTGTATFNVAPDKAGKSVSKIACFCFSQQTLAPGQSVDMPVSFYVDPDLAPDVGTLTLAYTFFPAAKSERSPTDGGY